MIDNVWCYFSVLFLSSSNVNDFSYFLMHQTNKLKTEACLEVLREAGGEWRIFMLDILHVAYQESTSQEICSLFC